MSSLTNTDELLTIGHLKVALGHEAADTTYDDILYNIVRDATTNVMAQIRPYLDADTNLAETKFHEMAVQLSLIIARAHWYEHNMQFDQAKHLEERYERQMQGLVQAIKTERNERDQAIYVTGSGDVLDRTYLPSEHDQYITREFI